MSDKHARSFNKRLSLLRKWLKPTTTWVEAQHPDTGAVTFFLTVQLGTQLTTLMGDDVEKPPEAVGAFVPNPKEVVILRPRCSNCREPWATHAPAGGKCLFQPTSYDHD